MKKNEIDEFIQTRFKKIDRYFHKSISNFETEHIREFREEIKRLKQKPGKDMIVLGSGSIVTQFAEKNLIDEYQVMIDPVAIGAGNAIFKKMNHQLDLKLISIKTFKSGVVLLCYQPLKN